MNAEQLLKHFDRISEAPDAVPRLRRFILDLAVRGKLVEQDSRDQSVPQLIKEIEKEKARLSEGRSAGRQAIFLELGNTEMSFPIPQNWRWVPATYPALLISDLGHKIQTKEILESGLIPVVDQGKIFIRGYCDDSTKVIRVKTPIVLFGDHTRETKLIDFDFIVGADGVKLLKPVCVLPTYYYLALQWLPLDSRGYGRHFKLLKAAFLPLPPLAEQHRIVAKVDDLMAICDELEALLASIEADSRRLLEAVLRDALAPALEAAA
jgi:type I restriction enzyme, S subunit